ncbi:DNA polymerase alpha subunit B-like [Chenopodium quinoa]|uniref:DNA polymerase alpha subunit B-like n=1 Tax=Chenopodium quinoa TaxID=63459 RepID=UPI000B799FD9|nr:DNA polymerase alpha subunit B-like [Chenopodium quinoa]
MEAEIKAEFNKSGFNIAEEDVVLNKCLTFCTEYKLTPSDLVSSWELYYLNRQLNESTVQNAEMDGFLLHLQNEQKEAFIKEESGWHAYSFRDVDMILNNEPIDTKEGILDTPTDKPLARYEELGDLGHGTNGSPVSSSKQSNILTPFGQRTNKFVVQYHTKTEPITEKGNKETEDEDMGDEFIRKAQPKNRCSLVIHGSKPEPGCRFMYDKIEDRFIYLVNRIKKHTSSFLASGQYEEPTDPTVASQKSMFAVGMICCDGEGRLNEKSVLLQSSIEHSGGEHVRLELEKVNQYSIFPGQVVGVVGTNPSGHCLVASKLVDAIPLLPSSDINLHPAKKLALNEEGLSNFQSPALAELSVIVAAGPFTTTDNLLFEPLKELLAYATRKQPQLLILLGPFVDSEHPEIQKPTFNRSFDEVFQHEIITRLRDHVEYMGSSTRVLLVPSTRDANHDHVFPQPPFDLNPEMKDQIMCLANPGIFDANEVKVGCCSVDVIKHLGGEEISKNLTSGSRLSRLATHIINQRSFYPLYPPAESVPLDFSIAPEALDLSSIPHMLILPSDLAPFVKVLSLNEEVKEQEHVKCLCVNPGRLAKGIGGGTFVEIYYNGIPETAYGSIIRI